MKLTETIDLRGGRPCWTDPDMTSLPADAMPERVDVAIVGAGIMGAMIAEMLSGAGRSVALIDRRLPAHGSTAASTALVLWAADVPMTQLAPRIGIENAVNAWKRVHKANLGLAAHVTELGFDCRWRSRPEVYLAGSLLDEEQLQQEASIRQSAGLPTVHMAPEEVAERFAIPPRAALLSNDAFGVDPIALTIGLLREARQAGATITYPLRVMHMDHDPHGVSLVMDDGSVLRASDVVLATGYEAARWYLPAIFGLSSSFAIATAPGTGSCWNEKALLWEASNPHLYARATVDGRIIIGGEDEETSDPTTRDTLLPTKRGILEAKGAALLGLDRLHADCAWAATFGTSPDGLPAIGRAANTDHVWLAYGFGGNGISFARLAAELLSAALAGKPDPDAPLFDPYRYS